MKPVTLTIGVHSLMSHWSDMFLVASHCRIQCLVVMVIWPLVLGLYLILQKA